MYDSFDHLRIEVVSIPNGILGPYNVVSPKSALYDRLVYEATELAKTLNENEDMLSDYLEKVGINYQCSFACKLEDRVFEYLLRIRLRPYEIDLRMFTVEENGMNDLDVLTFFIK